MSLVLDSILGSSGLLGVSSCGLLRVSGGSVIVEEETEQGSLLMGQCNSIISCLSVCPVDSGIFATGETGANPDVCIWEVTPQKVNLVGRLEDHDSDVVCLDFSIDGRYILSVSASQFVVNENSAPEFSAVSQFNIPHIATNVLVQGGFLKDVKRRNTGVYQFVTCGMKNVHFWLFDGVARSLEALPISSGLKQVRDYTCAAFSSDFEVLFAGTSSGDVLSVLAKNRVVQTLSAPLVVGGVSALHVVAGQIYIGAGDGTVVLGKTMHTEIVALAKIALNCGRIRSLAVVAGTVFAGGRQGAVFKVRFEGEGASKSREAEFKMTHRGSAQRVAMLRYPRGETASFFSAGDEIAVWDGVGNLSEQAQVKQLGVQCVDAVTDFFVVGGVGGKLHGFARPDISRRLWSIDGATRGSCVQTKISGNNRFVLAAGSEGELRLFDLKTKEMLTHFKEHNSAVTSLDIFADQFAVTAAKDRAIVMYDLKAERRISVHRERHQGVNAMVLLRGSTADAPSAVTAADKGLTFWDFRMQEPTRMVQLEHEISSLATTETGGHLGVSGNVQGVVNLWDFRAGQPLLSQYVSPAKHIGAVTTVAVAADARTVVSSGLDDQTIFVWNIFE